MNLDGETHISTLKYKTIVDVDVESFKLIT